MRNHINPKNNQPSPLVAEDVFDVIMQVLLPACLPKWDWL